MSGVYCQVGTHSVQEGHISVCAVCNVTCCAEHQGNKEALAGFLVSCPDHKEQVDAMNEDWIRQFRDNRGFRS